MEQTNITPKRSATRVYVKVRLQLGKVLGKCNIFIYCCSEGFYHESLGLKEIDDKTKYLGTTVFLFVKIKSKSFYSIVTKVRSKLGSWKSNLLSRQRRKRVLLKYVLRAIPTFSVLLPIFRRRFASSLIQSNQIYGGTCGR